MPPKSEARVHDEVTAFLGDPRTHGVHDRVEVIGTHCAIVFLAGDRAYKIKRPVKYDYLDFSTLAKRHEVLLRELSLNMPAAPMIYERVVPITRDPAGALAINGTGEAVEYVLVMNRFSADAELSSIAEAGGLTDALSSELGHSIAKYHAAAASLSTGEGTILIREIIDELGRVFADMSDALGANSISDFATGAEAQLSRNQSLLDKRAQAGKVRRCHGDLHLKNLVMIDDRPVPFDALEFDERLGTCDVFYDLAFLIMDLWHRGLRAQANVMLNGYVLASDDVDGLDALPLFLGIRSAIRAMVDIQTWRLTGESALARNAKSYLRDAHAFLHPAPPCLVAVGGLSGSGKTTIARQIAPDIGAPPGALHLRSDLERKATFNVDELTPLPESAYSVEATDRTYRRLYDKAAAALAAGHSVIVDATFLAASNRRAIEKIAIDTQVPFHPIWLAAPQDILLHRIRTRAPDASDATEDVLRAQIAAMPEPGNWPTVDASGTLETTVMAAKARLRAKGGKKEL